jgi:hypothetical protein
MSAEAEIQDAVAETAQTPEVTPVSNKPAGYEPVDLDGIPDDKAKAVNDRLNYLYKQAKDGQKSERELRELKNIASQQSALIEELRSNVGQVVNHIRGEQTADMEADLESKMEKAFEAGDIKAYNKAQKDLIAFYAKQNAPQQKQEVRQNLGKPAQNAHELAREAQEAGELTPQDARLMEAWASETDDTGNTIRPWTINNGGPEDPDPDFVKAAMIADQFYRKNPSASLNQVLAHVDTKMGVQKPSGQTVMGGNLTRPTKAAKISLTPKQQEIAVRTKFGSNKGAKSEAEYLEAYRKQLASVKGAK